MDGYTVDENGNITDKDGNYIANMTSCFYL